MSPQPDAGKSRLAYIDWARGLACVLMFQTHCYDSWLSPSARQSRFFVYSQLGGTFPAPLFLFLAGISFALITEKLWRKNLPPATIARSTIRRGAEIFAFGLAFRLQEYVVAWGWAPKTDLLRVDILNTIGLSMMMMGLLCWMVSAIFVVRETMPRVLYVVTAASIALTISLLTPLLWTTWRPRWLPWPLESYIDGVHNLGVPQQGIFPIFPWVGFAFAGLAVGFILEAGSREKTSQNREARVFFFLGAFGFGLIAFSRWLDAQPFQPYPVYDYWLTSPSFFLIRVGMLLVILTASYIWCRWGLARWSNAQYGVIPGSNTRWGFSPLIQLGQASLLVYWVHIEFVYGRVSILPKHADSIGMASLGLLIISLAMLSLAYIRTRKMKGFGAELMAWLRPART